MILKEKISAYLLDLANRCWLGEGLIVPVEEVDEAEDESSSRDSRRSTSGTSSFSSSSSFSSNIGGTSGGSLASFDFANDLCKSLILKAGFERKNFRYAQL
jgi:hypothetical protein